MNKNGLSRVSIPGRVIQLLLNDDEFFREVSALKKASSSGSFPKYDQWCDEFGFHMEFALAGYAKKDLEVLSLGQELIIRSLRNDASRPPSSESAEYSEPRYLSDLSYSDTENNQPSDSEIKATERVVVRRQNSPKINHGAIVRGIARRNFSVSFLIGQEFDVASTKAIVKDGLLHLMVPTKTEIITRTIEIVSGE